MRPDLSGVLVKSLIASAYMKLKSFINWDSLIK